jgi:hypothetical protein
VSGGNFVIATTGAACFVTCDGTETGWGCASFGDADRTIKVNGTSVKCSAALPAKKNGYYYFEIGATKTDHTWDAVWWSGTRVTTCPTPTGGFTP